MDDLWAMLGALATVALPLALAGWLLGRPPRPRTEHDDRHGNMPGPDHR